MGLELTKGTNLLGLNDISAATVISSVDATFANYDVVDQTSLASQVATVPALVWDALLADHVNTATFGEKVVNLSGGGGGGDPWVTDLPGSYTAGQAGYILGSLNSAIGNVPSNVWGDVVIEGGHEAAWFMRIFLAALANKVSGASSDHQLFRDLADTKNRIDATTSADGRSSVTLDGD